MTMDDIQEPKLNLLNVDDLSDNFRILFKKLKSKESISAAELKQISEEQISNCYPVSMTREIQSNLISAPLTILGLKPFTDWKISKIRSGHPGLIIIRNPFTSVGILQWVQRCVQHYSELPNKTNLYERNKSQSWWNEVSESLSRREQHKLTKKLRWATIGFHHNWTTKVYDYEDSSPMPPAINDLCEVLIKAVGIEQEEGKRYRAEIEEEEGKRCRAEIEEEEGKRYRAEAVIVNYYPPGSTLNPHTDHSEPNNKAPLISLSFGRSAVFLIGGRSKSVTPTPIILHQGDVIIMAGESRLCYHAVPRILNDLDMTHFEEFREFNEFRITIDRLIIALEEQSTTREVEVSLDLDKLASDLHENKGFSLTDSVRNCTVSKLELSKSSYGHLIDCKVLRALWTYIGDTRINMNIRQVHFENDFNKC